MYVTDDSPFLIVCIDIFLLSILYCIDTGVDSQILVLDVYKSVESTRITHTHNGLRHSRLFLSCSEILEVTDDYEVLALVRFFNPRTNHPDRILSSSNFVEVNELMLIY